MTLGDAGSLGDFFQLKVFLLPRHAQLMADGLEANRLCPVLSIFI